MTLHFNLSAEIRQATAALNDAAKKQVSFAVAKALTAVAFDVQRAERLQITATFKNPRPFTRRGVLVDKATKGAPVASVYLRPEVSAYLAPFEFGGRHHIPGRGIGIAYPKNVRLDAYGQVRQSPSALLARLNTFVASITFKRSGQTVSGIWERPASGLRRDGTRGTKGNTQNTVGGVRTGLKLLERFGDALETRKSLGFTDRATAVVAARWPAAFADALNKAMK